MRTSFRMEDKNISMIRGDTLSFGLELQNREGAAFTEDLDSAYFTCKANKTDSVHLFQKSLGQGITKVGDGQYVIRVAPSDTERVESGKYFYDFQIEVNGDRYTLMHGVLEIEQDVTWEV